MHPLPPTSPLPGTPLASLTRGQATSCCLLREEPIDWHCTSLYPIWSNQKAAGSIKEQGRSASAERAVVEGACIQEGEMRLEAVQVAAPVARLWRRPDGLGQRGQPRQQHVLHRRLIRYVLRPHIRLHHYMYINPTFLSWWRGESCPCQGSTSVSSSRPRPHQGVSIPFQLAFATITSKRQGASAYNACIAA